MRSMRAASSSNLNNEKPTSSKPPQDDLSTKIAQRDSNTRILLVDHTIPLPPRKPTPEPKKKPDPLLNNLFDSMIYPDVSFLVKGRRFPAHKGILATASEYFRKLFYERGEVMEGVDIEIEGVSAHVFQTVLEFIYTKNVSLTAELALDLLTVSKNYSLSELSSVTGNYLIVELTLDNFVQVANAIEQNNITHLRPRVLDFMTRHLVPLRQREDIKDVPVSFLVEVLDLLKPKDDI